MRVPSKPRHLLTLLVLGILVVSAGSMTTAAAGNGDASEEVRIVDVEFTIGDGIVTVQDTTIEGSVVPDSHVDHERVTVEESTVRFDGFHLEHDGTTYTFSRIVVHVDDVGLVLDDVGFQNTG